MENLGWLKYALIAAAIVLGLLYFNVRSKRKKRQGGSR